MNRIMLLNTGALAGVCLLVAAAPVSAGPVVYDSQSRTLRASLTEFYVQPDLSEIRRNDEATASAPDAAAWDGTVTAQIDDPPQGPDDNPGFSTISQRSSLADNGITATGEGSGRTETQDGSYGWTTALDVTFTLDETRTYDLDYLLGVGTLFETNETIRLTRVDGGTVIFDEDPEFGVTPPDGEAVGSRTGELAPGQYRFEFLFEGGGDVGNELPYNLSLALAPTDGGPGPGPNPIPLPPAAWSALATMGAMGALKLRRHLRSPAR